MEWTIRQMAKLTGLSADSLRYYDKQGIVSPQRGDNGYRLYSERDYVMLQYITVMKYAHFSLREMKSITQNMGREPSDDCNRMDRELLSAKREELAERIRIYRRIIQYLDTVLSMVETADTFAENEAALDAYVKEVYDQVNKMGDSV